MRSNTHSTATEPICDRIIPYNNQTAVIPGYEGIPQNVLINMVSWAFLLLLFAIFRKFAWDYGRMALTKPKRSKWAQLFYSEVRRSHSDTESHDSTEVAFASRDRGFLSWIKTCFTLTNSDLERKAGIDAVHYLRFQFYLIVYSAITMFFCLVVILPLNMKGTLKSSDLQAFGVTTISNLSGDSPMLWAHVILGFAFFLLAFALLQHFSGRLLREASRVNIISQRTLMISGISRSHCQRDLILRHFREAFPDCEIDDIQVCFDIRRLVNLESRWETAKEALKYSQHRLTIKGTRPIMIPCCCGWSCAMCYRSGHCQCCCDHAHLSDSANSAPAIRLTSTDFLDTSCCAPYVTPIDAIDYYGLEADRLRRQIDEECARAVKTKIGIAFITFSSKESAALVYHTYNSVCSCLRQMPLTSTSKLLRTRAWTVTFAPTPNNIIWPNLSVTRTVWWIRAIAINVCVFIVVFFLTTPTYVLNLVNKLKLTERLQINNAVIIQFIPSFILWSVSALLPMLVYRSDHLIGHWTRSGLHLTVMAKTFTLLILMVLLLPSLGLTSIPALLQWLFPDIQWFPIEPPEGADATTMSVFQTNTTRTVTSIIPTPGGVIDEPIEVAGTVPWVPVIPPSFQWECVFMPDNGAFFVNYVITSAFIGTALQLVRLPELLMYSLRILSVRSEAEQVSIRKNSQVEFDFGLYYAWTLCVFAVVSTYSILCPLITPFGLLYLIFKCLVDRYNLFFAYLPSRIDSRIHWLAINFMLFAVLLLQLNLLMFVSIRLGVVSSLISLVALVCFTLSVIIWLATIVTGWMFIGSNSTRQQPLVPSIGDVAASQDPADHWAPMTNRLPQSANSIDAFPIITLNQAEKTEGSVTTLSSDGSAVPTEPYPTATTMDETSLVLTDVPITPVARLRASTNVQSTGDATSLFIAPILLQLTEHSPDDITSIALKTASE